MKTAKIFQTTLAIALSIVFCFPLSADKLSAGASRMSAPPCSVPIGVIKEMRVDFGAVGDGITDDSKAFKRASDWINANWSTSSAIKIIVPAGTYLVGHQVKKGEIWNYGTGSINNPSQSYLGVSVFNLTNVQNVIIEGDTSMNTRIIYKNGLMYGGYRTDTESPCTAYGSCNTCPGGGDVATVGPFLFLTKCSCVTVSNFWVEGRYNMCKRQGMVCDCGSIQLQYDGMLIAGGSDITISDVVCTNFGRDGLMTYFSGGSDVTNLTLNDVICSGNGRQGYSLCSGINIAAYNCDFILTGNIKDGAIYSGNPQAGLDLESDQGGTINNCNFTKCRFSRNTSVAVISDNYYPSNVTFDSCLFSSLTSWALWLNGMKSGVVKNSTVVGPITHIRGDNPSDHLRLDNNIFTDWFGNWDTPVLSTWAQGTSSGRYLLNLPNSDNMYYDFTNNNIDLHHSKLVYTDGNNPSTERVWDGNTFTFNSSDLLNSTMGYPDAYDNPLFGHLGHFKNCTLRSNQFIDATPTVTRTKLFYVSVKGYAGSPHPPTDNVTNGVNYWGPDTGPYSQIEYNFNWLASYFNRNLGFW